MGILLSMRPIKNFQISFPSMAHVRRMGEDMIEWTNNRRHFHGKPFIKQDFYNCLIMGVHEVETQEDLDFEEIKRKGLLAVIIDRGASRLSRDMVNDDRPRGIRAATLPRDVGDAAGPSAIRRDAEAAAPKEPERPRLRKFVLPLDFARDAGNAEAERVDRKNDPAMHD